MEQNYVSATAGRQSNIDFIRIFSLLIVMIAHYSLAPFPYMAGAQGVVLFFFISGYCIAMTSEKKISFKDFWIARLKRLLPVFFWSCLFIFFAKLLLHPLTDLRSTTFRELGMTLLGVPLLDIPMILLSAFNGARDYFFVDGAMWSLLAEFRFYFLFGIIYFLFGLKQRTVIPLLILSLGSIWVTGQTHSRLNDFLLYLVYFSYGMGYYLNASKRETKLGTAAMALSFIFFCLMFIFEVRQVSMALESSYEFLVYAPVFLVFNLLMRFTNIKSGPGEKAVFYLAQLTYPAYLIHMDLGLIMIESYQKFVSTDSAVFRFFLIPLMFVMAHGIFKLSERFPVFFKRSVRV